MRKSVFLQILLLGFLAISTHAQQTCQNGIREGTEQCDDGNAFNGDGCSTTCQLEDPTGTVFTCVTDMSVLSSCCRTLINPVTTQAVCTCAGQVRLQNHITKNTHK
jgi:cysteine-rich repeat protein